MDALSFGLGEKFAEGAQGFGVRMANGDGLAFLAGIFGGELQLAANGADFLNIIEKRDVVVIAGTASAGKSLIFQCLHFVTEGGISLIVSPLVALRETRYCQ